MFNFIYNTNILILDWFCCNIWFIPKLQFLYSLLSWIAELFELTYWTRTITNLLHSKVINYNISKQCRLMMSEFSLLQLSTIRPWMDSAHTILWTSFMNTPIKFHTSFCNRNLFNLKYNLIQSNYETLYPIFFYLLPVKNTFHSVLLFIVQYIPFHSLDHIFNKFKAFL